MRDFKQYAATKLINYDDAIFVAQFLENTAKAIRCMPHLDSDDVRIDDANDCDKSAKFLRRFAKGTTHFEIKLVRNILKDFDTEFCDTLHEQFVDCCVKHGKTALVRKANIFATQDTQEEMIAFYEAHYATA